MLEEVAWKQESSIWEELAALQVNNAEKEGGVKAGMAFPLFEDVQPIGSSLPPCAATSQPDLILNLSPNPSATSSAHLQPAPKRPTITRVVGLSSPVCGGDPVPAARSISTRRPDEHALRLINITPALACFFHKFYSLGKSD